MFKTSIDNSLTRGNKAEIQSWSRYLVDYGANGTRWYRKYSDGWLEQGFIQASEAQQFTFLKPFANTNYVVASASIGENHSGGLPILSAKTTTYLTMNYQNNIFCAGWGA